MWFTNTLALIIHFLVKSIFFSVTITFSSLLLQAQEGVTNNDNFAKNSIYLELLGTGSLYSINFDRILIKNGALGLAGRVGLTYSPVIKDFSDIGGPGIPFGLSALYRNNNNLLELGMGGTYHYLFDEPDNTHFLFFVPRIGYRNQKPEGGFFYRIAFTPWIPLVIDKDIKKGDIEPTFLPMLGFSIGYTFGKIMLTKPMNEWGVNSQDT